MSDSYTTFATIYDSFLARVTSDMYMEMSEIETTEQLQSLLLNSLHRFRFPKFDISDYEEGYYDYLGTYSGAESDGIEVTAEGWVGGHFNTILTAEEVNILSLNMVVEWFVQQLNTTELTKMKYSGPDFKFTSQANHMAKLKVMIEQYRTDSHNMQDMYRRRIFSSEGSKSTMGQIMTKPSYGWRI